MCMVVEIYVAKVLNVYLISLVGIDCQIVDCRTILGDSF